MVEKLQTPPKEIFISYFYDGKDPAQVAIRERAERVAEERGVGFRAHDINLTPGLGNVSTPWLLTPEGTGNNPQQIKTLLDIPPNSTLHALLKKKRE